MTNLEAFNYITENLSRYPEDTRSIMYCLAYHMPYSKPSIDLLSERVGICKRTVMRRIKKLEDLGLINVVRTHRQSNLYTIVLSDTIESPKANSLGDKKRGSWVTKNGTLGDTPQSPQQSKNNQIKEAGNDFNKITDEEKKEFEDLFQNTMRKIGNVSV